MGSGFHATNKRPPRQWNVWGPIEHRTEFDGPAVKGRNRLSIASRGNSLGLPYSHDRVRNPFCVFIQCFHGPHGVVGNTVYAIR